MEKIRKIFIDCGVWTGDSIKAFKKYNDNFEIYGFECEPRLTEELEKLSKSLKFTFINKAVWVNNFEIKLYPGQGNLTQSSSLDFNKKKYINKKDPVRVDAIDFSQWIIDNFEKEDYIICKMNIEGAEYQVLPKMILDGSIDYIDKLFISWHWRKLKGYTQRANDDLVKQLAFRTVLLKWKFVEGQLGNPF